jgi:hypothetical protein
MLAERVMAVSDIYLAMQNLDGMIKKNLPRTFLELKSNYATGDLSPIDVICLASLAIVFAGIMIKFFADIVNEGYSSNLLSDTVLKMILFAVFINPVFYKIFAGFYVDMSSLFFNDLANSQFLIVRDKLFEMYNGLYGQGQSGIARIFAFFDVNTHIWTFVSSMCFLLFAIAMYEILTLPQILTVFIIAVAPLMIAFEPICKGMIRKLVNMIFGIGIIFPVVLFVMGCFLPTSIVLVSELLQNDSMQLLAIVCIAYSFVIAYSLPLIGYITGFSAIGEFRVLFPIAWFEFFTTKTAKLFGLELAAIFAKKTTKGRI